MKEISQHSHEPELAKTYDDGLCGQATDAQGLRARVGPYPGNRAMTTMMAITGFTSMVCTP